MCPHCYLHFAYVCLQAVASFIAQHTTVMCSARGQIFAFLMIVLSCFPLCVLDMDVDVPRDRSHVHRLPVHGDAA